MKAFLFLVVVLIGCSNAKPYSAARSSPTCLDLPKQLSGRLYMVTEEDSGSSYRLDMTFNLDINLQMMHTEVTDVDVAGTFNTLMDLKKRKMYLEYYQGYCVTVPLTDQDIIIIQESKDLSYETSGKLGSKGTLVDLNLLKKDGASGMVTFEAGSQCIPVSFAIKENTTTLVGSYFDLKTTADTEKFKIPEYCQDISRRSIPALIHSVHLNKAVKRGFPWIDAPVTSKKRGFPWIDLQDIRKRRFPWPLNG